jgi:Reverse transcriptase (RNA-dependent DNA polymerase)
LVQPIKGKALYGLKTSTHAWRTHLAETLRELNFEICAADNDVWLCKSVKVDGTEYYKYVQVYADDILVISHAPLEILNCLDQHHVLKPGSIRPLKQYLGAQVGEFSLPDESEKVRWSLSSEKYAKEAI